MARGKFLQQLSTYIGCLLITTWLWVVGFSCNNNPNAEQPHVEHNKTNKIKRPAVYDTITTGNNSSNHLIKVTAPLPNAYVHTPLTVAGQAKGPWYFEGSFPVLLYDATGKLLARQNATANGSWMTTAFVPFTLVLSFTPPETKSGKLVLMRSNPSGLPENSQSLTIPLQFTPPDSAP